MSLATILATGCEGSHARAAHRNNGPSAESIEQRGQSSASLAHHLGVCCWHSKDGDQRVPGVLSEAITIAFDDAQADRERFVELPFCGACFGQLQLQFPVFGRGVGESLSCGTGACAAMVAGRLQGLLDENVTVTLPGGDLEISWHGDKTTVKMTGPACRVYEGRLHL